MMKFQSSSWRLFFHLHITETTMEKKLEWEWRVYNNWTTVRKINTTKHCNLNLRRRRIFRVGFSLSMLPSLWPSSFKQVNPFSVSHEAEVARSEICFDGKAWSEFTLKRKCLLNEFDFTTNINFFPFKLEIRHSWFYIVWWKVKI